MNGHHSLRRNCGDDLVLHLIRKEGEFSEFGVRRLLRFAEAKQSFPFFSICSKTVASAINRKCLLTTLSATDTNGLFVAREWVVLLRGLSLFLLGISGFVVKAESAEVPELLFAGRA
jgi:hypothetical protein